MKCFHQAVPVNLVHTQIIEESRKLFVGYSTIEGGDEAFLGGAKRVEHDALVAGADLKAIEISPKCGLVWVYSKHRKSESLCKISRADYPHAGLAVTRREVP